MSKFFCFEGIEGSGKSTIISKISEYFNKKKISHIATREPGGTAFGEQVRSILLHSNIKSAKAELCLLNACRIEHINNIIKPALDSNKIVLCDRFLASTIAYQGAGRKLNIDYILQMHKLVCNNTMPDAIFILDIDSKTSRERIQHRGKLDRIEQENKHFFEKVRKEYLNCNKYLNIPIHIIDSRMNLDNMTEEILGIIKNAI